MALLRHLPSNPGSALVLAVLSIFLVSCQTVEEQEPGSSADPGTHKRSEVQTQLAIGYLRQGQLQRALARIQKVVRRDANYAPAQNALGLIYDRLAQPQEAGRRYRQATKIDPAFGSARNNYGGWLCRSGRYGEAEKEFRAAADNPLYDVPHIALFNAGVCMRQKGDKDAAIRYFKKSLSRNPKFPQALYAMSEQSLLRSKYLSARGYLQRYLDVSSHSPKTLWLGIRLERELGDKDAVSSYSMLLKRKYPESEETGKLRAWERK